MKPICIQFSGLPGSGKTTLARKLTSHLQIPVFSKDRIERVLKADGLTDGGSITSYHLLLDMADEQLSMGVSVILDAVFPLAGFRHRVREIAQQHDADLFVIHTFCSDEQTYQERMTNRVTYHPGWTPKGWEEVLRLREMYESWSPDDALFVDSIESVDDNLEKIVTTFQLQK